MMINELVKYFMVKDFCDSQTIVSKMTRGWCQLRSAWIKSWSEPSEWEALTHHYATVWGRLLWRSFPWCIKIDYSEWFKVGKRYIPTFRDRTLIQTFSLIALPPGRIFVGMSSTKIHIMCSVLCCLQISVGSWGQREDVAKGAAGLSFSMRRVVSNQVVTGFP